MNIINLLEVRIICTTCALCFSLMCILYVYCEIHFTRVFIVHFRLSKILLDLQDDSSDVAESLIHVGK